MADNSTPAQDTTTPSKDFHAFVESKRMVLNQRLQESQDAPKVINGFDLYENLHYLDILDPILNHKDLKKQHGGELHKLHICVSTKTIKQEKTITSHAGSSDISWLLVLSAGEEERDKIGQTFNRYTKFSIKKGEIFVGFKRVPAK